MTSAPGLLLEHAAYLSAPQQRAGSPVQERVHAPRFRQTLDDSGTELYRIGIPANSLSLLVSRDIRGTPVRAARRPRASLGTSCQRTLQTYSFSVFFPPACYALCSSSSQA